MHKAAVFLRFLEAAHGQPNRLRRTIDMRRIYFSAVVLALTLVSLGTSKMLRADDKSGGEEQIKQEVLKVSGEIDDAVGTNNATGLDAHVSDQLEYTLQSGEVLSKADWQARLGSKKIKTLVLKHEVSHVHVYNGDTVVLTGISHSTVVFKGKLSNTPRKFTRTFVKQNGTWMLVAQHVTLVSGE